MKYCISRLFALFSMPLCVITPASAIQLQQIASGFSLPVLVTSARDGSNRLFVVEQGGKILVLRNGRKRPTPFLNISKRVSRGGEQGLLSVAFHPKFRRNRKLYINYTDTKGRTNVVEYKTFRENRNRVDTRTRRSILRVAQPFENHNGGFLAFGSDGYLYIGLGDGGSGGDPGNRAQNLGLLLGKMLRIDVNTSRGYRIPATNPFVGVRGVRKEIWASGFRNPWRYSFDRATGRLFAGDVGQGAIEEIDIVEPGANYGWRLFEGSSCFDPSLGCQTTGLTFPISEYSHSEGEAVTGGYVYRGVSAPSLAGKYFFADFGSGRLWSLEETTPGTWTRTVLQDTALNISSFGEDEAGDVLVVDYGGGIYRITD
ncbi:MAG: PQQ-dependent sugar dehydrogenase [Gammaproteobacteria bacterium]